MVGLDMVADLDEQATPFVAVENALGDPYIVNPNVEPQSGTTVVAKQAVGEEAVFGGALLDAACFPPAVDRFPTVADPGVVFVGESVAIGRAAGVSAACDHAVSQ